MRTVFNPTAAMAIVFYLFLSVVSRDHAREVEPGDPVPVNAAPAADWRARRVELNEQFEIELHQIAQWCRESGLEAHIPATMALLIPRDPGRQYIFLPRTETMPAPGEDPIGQWQLKINTACRNHADRVWQLARSAIEAEDGAIAFRLLNEVIHYDLDHQQVRKALGHVKRDGAWHVAPDSIRPTTSRKKHDFLSWPAGSFTRVLTPHFEIESNASEARTRVLAENLEKWHDVWRQLFLEYWSSSAAVARWVDGTSSLRVSTKRFRVVFFQNRNDYLQELSQLVRGIEVSTGYYSSSQQVSFFYDGGSLEQETWRHELTHQLFRESGRSREDAFESQFIWLDEGIATYFESMTDFGDYVTLGGFEARRLQYARLRRLLEDYHVPLEELSGIGRTGLQRRSDIARLYSQAAGVTDMLMNDQHGAHEQALVEFLKLIYKGRVKANSFETIIGESYQALDDRYPAYLKVPSETIETFLSQPATRTELSLSGSQLTLAAFRSIGACANLQWLDLSGNSIDREQLLALKGCSQISQLIITNGRLETGALEVLGQFPQLDELDLSGSTVGDPEMSGLARIPTLRILRLSGTTVTDQAIPLLSNLPHLQQLDLTGTAVTAPVLAALRAARPRLTILR